MLSIQAKKIVPLVLLLCLSFILKAQKAKVENLPKYDQQNIHFGFTLGINYTNFIVHPAADIKKLDSVFVVESNRQPGFNLGIVSDLRLGEHFNLRFVPDLSFASRTLDFTLVSPSDTFMITKEVESTFIDLPLFLKFKSARLNNFRAYVLGGFKYTIDLASQKDVNSKLLKDIIIKIKDNDLSYEFGFGMDFYTTYFKFSPEIKYSIGLRNVLIKEDNLFANAIDRLNSKVFLISFTFE